MDDDCVRAAASIVVGSDESETRTGVDSSTVVDSSVLEKAVVAE